MDTILSQRRRHLMLGLGALAVVGRAHARAAAGSTYVAFGGQTMGSTWTVRLDAAGQDPQRLRDDVQAALDAVEARMSMYRPDSELSRLNRAAAGPVTLSDSLYAVLAAASEVSEWSGGAFDVTVAPLVEAWGFGTRAVRRMPAAVDVERGRRLVDWRSLSLDAARRQAVKRHAGMHADLGGIAKGYGVDRAAAALEARSVRHYMLEAGGEVRTRGLNAAAQPWRIGIEQPDAQVQRARWAVPLTGRVMATSGDYRNFFVQDGVRYSHAIDAGRGAPIRHGLCSVTVVADDCMRADALATALIVLGPDRGPSLAEASGIAALFIERRGATLVDRQTAAFAALGAVRV